MSLKTSMPRLTIVQAVAACLTTTTLATEVGLNLSNLLKEVRALLKDPLLTLSRIKDEVIGKWQSAGWLKLTGNYVAMTEVGKTEITSIAASAV